MVEAPLARPIRGAGRQTLRGPVRRPPGGRPRAHRTPGLGWGSPRSRSAPRSAARVGRPCLPVPVRPSRRRVRGSPSRPTPDRATTVRSWRRPARAWCHTLTMSRRAPRRVASATAKCSAPWEPSEPSTPTTTRPSSPEAGLPAGTTTTGNVAWMAHFWLTEPATAEPIQPRPCDPTTSTPPSRPASSKAGAGSSRTSFGSIDSDGASRRRARRRRHRGDSAHRARRESARGRASPGVRRGRASATHARPAAARHAGTRRRRPSPVPCPPVDEPSTPTTTGSLLVRRHSAMLTDRPVPA